MEDSSIHDERGASDLLDGLGLGKVLLDLGVADERVSDAMTRLGVMAGRSDRLESAQVYKETFEDDDGELGPEAGTEAAGQDETGRSQAERYYQTGLSLLPSLSGSRELSWTERTAVRKQALMEIQFLAQSPQQAQTRRKNLFACCKTCFQTFTEVKSWTLLSCSWAKHPARSEGSAISNLTVSGVPCQNSLVFVR